MRKHFLKNDRKESGPSVGIASTVNDILFIKWIVAKIAELYQQT